ncbi:MAG: sulfatase-like hydrolase/transferase, partial [Opitutales bacterium]|nr:sulfatase-like hydrolase/transferase [Opitutales bacterium]
FQPMRSTLRNPPRMFTHELVEAGYEVYWPTKQDFNFVPEGNWCSSQEEWWKEGLPKDKPFFAYRNVACTHESGMWAPPGERFDWMEPVEVAYADPALVPVPSYLPDLPEVRRQIAYYYDNLAQQDQEWGECLRALESSGQADNTLVIYLTDHGRGLPLEKRWCYEAGLHLPLIMRWPKKIKPAQIRTDLVSWVDLAPTILHLAGLEAPERMSGEVSYPAAESSPRKYHFAGRDRMDEAYDHQRVCRSADWLYVRNAFPEIPYSRRNQYQENAPAVQAMRQAWAEGKLSWPADRWFQKQKPAEELFHVPTDPECLHNLAGESRCQSVLAEHREALESHLKAVGDWGEVREEVLVEKGILEDQIKEYEARIAPLPAEFALEETPSDIQRPRGH